MTRIEKNANIKTLTNMLLDEQREMEEVKMERKIL
jgi:hypothetical protein